MNDAYCSGQRFLTDQDARPASAASPYAHLWDSGSNAVDELDRMMKVRAAVLERFGENNIREGEPMATLEDRPGAGSICCIAIKWRRRRKLSAEWTTRLRVRGDVLTPTKPVPAAEQRRALDAVLATLTPDALGLPPVAAAVDSAAPAGLSADARTFPATYCADL